MGPSAEIRCPEQPGEASTLGAFEQLDFLGTRKRVHLGAVDWFAQQRLKGPINDGNGCTGIEGKAIFFCSQPHWYYQQVTVLGHGEFLNDVVLCRIFPARARLGKRLLVSRQISVALAFLVPHYAKSRAFLILLRHESECFSLVLGRLGKITI
jgi:hypothetical protein